MHVGTNHLPEDDQGDTAKKIYKLKFFLNNELLA